MYVTVDDNQAVASGDAPMLTMVQQTPISALATLVNTGPNVIAYHWQQYSAGTWADLSATTPLTGALLAGANASMAVLAAFPQVRLMALASGGSTMNFSIQRWADRPSGGIIPLLNY